MIGISAVAMPLLDRAGGSVAGLFVMAFIVSWCFGTQRPGAFCTAGLAAIVRICELLKASGRSGLHDRSGGPCPPVSAGLPKPKEHRLGRRWAGIFPES